MRRYGKQVPPIKADALHYQLFVLPGAAMSPADIVKALRDFIADRVPMRGVAGLMATTIAGMAGLVSLPPLAV